MIGVMKGDMRCTCELAKDITLWSTGFRVKHRATEHETLSKGGAPKANDQTDRFEKVNELVPGSRASILENL